MVSLRQRVFDLYDIIKSDGIDKLTHDHLCQTFPNEKRDVLKVYLSEARSPIRKIKERPINKINLDNIESRIIAIVNKSPNAQNMKLALDFIRLKQSTEGLQDEIDIEKYLKKVEGITNSLGVPSDGETSVTRENDKPRKSRSIGTDSKPLAITSCQDVVDKNYDGTETIIPITIGSCQGEVDVVDGDILLHEDWDVNRPTVLTRHIELPHQEPVKEIDKK